MAQRYTINLNLQSISVKNLPNIFKTLKLTLEVNIFHEKDFCKIKRHILNKCGVAQW